MLKEDARPRAVNADAFQRFFEIIFFVRQAIIDALRVSCTERNLPEREPVDAFTTLQALTRYVDHTRDSDDTESRLFGSGAALKAKGMALLAAL